MLRKLIPTYKKLIDNEVSKLKPSVGNKILILKNINVIPSYPVSELSF